MEVPRVPEFYAGKSILITGSTGFLGRVLVEKLLRSCSDLEKIYVIVRPMKNKSSTERWNEATQVLLFDRLREERPGLLEKKVAVLEGDVTQLQLGLSSEAYRLLQKEVSVVFHVAASVRFNEPLPDAALINLRGTREAIHLAAGCKQLKVFLHVSTTYCNCNLPRAEERLYEPQADWRQLISIAETLDRTEVTALQLKYLSNFPNTYTFTKNLAEALIWDYRNLIPAVIMRPSVVTPSVKEPFSGWIDNLNGPSAILVGIGKGVVRAMITDEEAATDYVAVDEVIFKLIIGAWFHGNRPAYGEVPVYNISRPEIGVTSRGMVPMGVRANELAPFKEALWRPAPVTFWKSQRGYKIHTIFVHLLPALVLDLVLKTLKMKPINLVKVTTKIQVAMLALQYFLTGQWMFPNDKCRGLEKELLPEDLDDFTIELKEFDISVVMTNGFMILKKTIFHINNNEEYYEMARRNAKRYVGKV